MITGRVQGVYYRAWTVQTALRLGLTGWVRNRSDGSVEAVFQGQPEALAEMVAACHHGPTDALVKSVQQSPHDPIEDSDFSQRATV